MRAHQNANLLCNKMPAGSLVLTMYEVARHLMLSTRKDASQLPFFPPSIYILTCHFTLISVVMTDTINLMTQKVFLK